jgi:hypothetical protein
MCFSRYIFLHHLEHQILTGNKQYSFYLDYIMWKKVGEYKLIYISMYLVLILIIGEEIHGKILCQRHPHEKRGLIIHLHVFDSKFKFYLE